MRSRSEKCECKPCQGVWEKSETKVHIALPKIGLNLLMSANLVQFGARYARLWTRQVQIEISTSRSVGTFCSLMVLDLQSHLAGMDQRTTIELGNLGLHRGVVALGSRVIELTSNWGFSGLAALSGKVSCLVQEEDGEELGLFIVPVAAKRGRSPPPQSKRTSPLTRKASTENNSLVLFIDSLSRNVNEGHLREIFSNFGEVVNVELVMDRAVNLPRGSGYVQFKTRADAEKAQLYMDGAQIDGNVVRATFTLSLPKKVSPPPKPVASASKRDASRTDNASVDIEKDGPKRPRECGDLLLRPEVVLRPLPQGGIDHRLLGLLPEEYVAVLSADVLPFLQGAGNLLID
ncbi:hypothetical protein EZV62_007815 [Acer yangbiense]|uniref:RRM domain-containing protein n=1 Tax=Acer yangbiense TaxID=1000413 RepID=A0A5C7IB25_9ROSI|nr:hypothetical protein EZV62_007815 [Acer yangbiense]